MGVGKSTIGKLLATKLDLPQVSMDKLRWKYYKEKDWTEKRQEDIGDKEGFSGVYKYWKQYDVHAVERLLQEYHKFTKILQISLVFASSWLRMRMLSCFCLLPIWPSQSQF